MRYLLWQNAIGTDGEAAAGANAQSPLPNTVNRFRPSSPPFYKNLYREEDKAGYDVSVLPGIVRRTLLTLF
jgi:hypothetical protein